MNNRLIEVINNTKPQVQEICHKYGVYGNVIIYDSYLPESDSSDAKLYIVAGLNPDIENDPISLSIKPEEIIRRNNRTEGLFYTDLWVWDMTEGNRMQAFEELMDYGNAVEFLNRVYSEFKTPFPDKIWKHEINGLITHYKEYVKGFFDKKAPFEKAKLQLDKFFKNENSSSPVKKAWLNFYRSDKYPADKNIVAKLNSFRNRNSNIIDIDTLMDNSYEVQTTEMEEFEYKIFAQKMKDLYPDVSYAVSDVDIIDHGGVGTVDTTTDPPTKYVTQEEFAVTLKNRFAEEGWNCIRNLKPSYWEVRKVHYRKVDEPIIARVYNAIVYQYTNSLKQQTIDYDGDVSLHRISTNNFMNFVSEAKAHNLRYYLDFKGAYGETSLDFINVITRKSSDPIVNEVINNTLSFKLENDHKSLLVNPTLSDQIENVSRTILETEIKNENIKPLKKEYINETEDKVYF